MAWDESIRCPDREHSKLDWLTVPIHLLYLFSSGDPCNEVDQRDDEKHKTDNIKGELDPAEDLIIPVPGSH